MSWRALAAAYCHCHVLESFGCWLLSLPCPGQLWLLITVIAMSWRALAVAYCHCHVLESFGCWLLALPCPGELWLLITVIAMSWRALAVAYCHCHVLDSFDCWLLKSLRVQSYTTAFMRGWEDYDREACSIPSVSYQCLSTTRALFDKGTLERHINTNGIYILLEIISCGDSPGILLKLLL